MVATILQLIGIATANLGGYMVAPGAGLIVSGVSVVFVGLAMERG